MHFNEIDDILKKSLLESGKRNEAYAEDAKLRVWDSIQKPKKKSGLNWPFVLALAAAISFFLVSTFLVLRLQSKQEEFLALQLSLRQESMTIAQQPNRVEKEKAELEEKKPTEIKKAVSALPVNSKHKDYNQAPEKVTEAKQEETHPEIPVLFETIVKIQVPEIVIPEIDTNELKADLDSPSGLQVDIPVTSQPKSKAKLRFRFGNMNPTINSGNSLALSIKL